VAEDDVTRRAAGLRARGVILCTRAGQKITPADLDVVEAFLGFLRRKAAQPTPPGRRDPRQRWLDMGHDPQWIEAEGAGLLPSPPGSSPYRWAGFMCRACQLWSYAGERNGPTMANTLCTPQRKGDDHGTGPGGDRPG
jgi:hypothetical protein